MNTKYRAQILLEAEQHAALAEIAQQENRSISDVVRDWLTVQDHEAQRQRELRALDELTQLRLKIQERHGIYTADLIEEVRAERDEETQSAWRGEA